MNLLLPQKFKIIWRKCKPFLKKGRPDDLTHAHETTSFILNYKGNIKLDKDILIPTAMMHDVGHAAILPEHFKYVTGPEKIVNGKIVHMLSGAKIAQDILYAVNYDKKKTKEIVDIISIHDFDQLKFININKAYNSRNKKVFHDIDSLDRYTAKRIDNISSIYKDKDKLLNLLEEFLDLFFYKEFRIIAEQRLKELR